MLCDKYDVIQCWETLAGKNKNGKEIQKTEKE